MAKKKQQLTYNTQKFEEPKTLLVRHILVPFDDSHYSRNAFNIALDLANKYHAKISVVSIFYSSVMGSSFLDQRTHQTSIEKNHLKKLKKAFEELKTLALKHGVPYYSDVIVSTSVADALLGFAGSQKADLIVMGTRGKTGGGKQLRLGSVAIDISQNATCPVMFVK